MIFSKHLLVDQFNFDNLEIFCKLFGFHDDYIVCCTEEALECFTLVKYILWIYITSQCMFVGPKPLMIKLTSTNETIQFNASSTDRRVNGGQVFYIEHSGGTIQNKTFYGKLLLSEEIDGLKSGTCYNLTFYSLFGEAISYDSTEAYFCTGI